MELNLQKLSDDVRNKLIKANLTTTGQILLLTANELQAIGNFTTEDVKNIFYLAAETTIQSSPVEEDLFTITTGCEKIDAVLGGGLRRSSGVYELSGESGCGKTQLCLQLTLTAQNPLSLGGIDKSVLYICTEDSFPSKRLAQLIDNVPRPFKSCQEIPYGDRIYVEHIPDVNGLKDSLFNRVPKLLSTGKIGLLIVDSVAAVFRSEYSPQEGLRRTKDLRTIGCHLSSLSRKHNICVLCVNQVTASMSIADREPIPALGLAWANLVTTRILMRKRQLQDSREIQLIFSPLTGPASCNYAITKTGIKGI